MDAYRGAAMLLVIAWHVFSVPSVRGVGMEAAVTGFFDTIAPVRMPLMFILSGMLLPLALSKPFPAYLIGKLRNLLWPYVVWFIITVIVNGSFGALTDFWLLVGGPFHLWFLAVLVCCFVVAPAAKVVSPLAIAVVMQVALNFGGFSTNAINRFLFWGSLFFIGAWLWSKRERLAQRGVWFPLACAATGVLASTLFGRAGEESAADLTWDCRTVR